MSLPINHSSNSHPFIFALAACALTTVCEQTANADELEVPLERTGIVYSIGHVESVINRGAVIDLGDAHTLRVAESVALIRQTENYFTPVGILRISETYPTFCHAHPSSVKPQNGDIVIFIREFLDLKTPEIYLGRISSATVDREQWIQWILNTPSFRHCHGTAHVYEESAKMGEKQEQHTRLHEWKFIRGWR